MNLTVSSDLLERAGQRGERADVLSLWRKRTANVYRGVLELECELRAPDDVGVMVREVVKQEFAPGLVVPFAFGSVLRYQTDAPAAAEMERLVDTKGRSAGTWQWLIVTDNGSRKAYGVHTWQRGYLTPVYEALLLQLQGAGYDCKSEWRSPDRLFLRLRDLNTSLARVRKVLLFAGAGLTGLLLVAQLFWRR